MLAAVPNAEPVLAQIYAEAEIGLLAADAAQMYEVSVIVKMRIERRRRLRRFGCRRSFGAI